MQFILIGIFAVVGYVFILQKLTNRMENRNSLPVVGVIVLLIYGCILGYLIMVCRLLGNISLMIYLMLLLAAFVWIGVGIRSCFVNWGTLRAIPVICLILYIAAVFYITVFSRQERYETVIQMEVLYSVKQAISGQSTEEFNHLILNMVLFVPIGFLFPMIHPQKRQDWKIACINGLVLSTLIESVQLMFRLGHCDIDDIIANTIGAVFGFLLYQLFVSRKYL